MKTSLWPFAARLRRPRMPLGSRPASSANRQNRSRSRKWATASGSWPRERRPWAISAKLLAAFSVICGGLDPRAELVRRGEDVAEQEQGPGGIGRDLVEGDRLDDGLEAREVGVDLDPLDVADDQERRVLQVLAVVRAAACRRP